MQDAAMKRAAGWFWFVLVAIAVPCQAQAEPVGETPQSVVRALFERYSFDPEQQPDPQTLLELFTEGGVVAFGTNIGDMIALPVGEFLEQLERKVRDGEVGGVGHEHALEQLECKVQRETAQCQATESIIVPGRKENRFSVQNGVFLKRVDGRWYIASVSWQVELPEEDDSRPTTPEEYGLLEYPAAGGEIEPTPGRTWDRALPLLGKKVVALGFDLPNPFGLKLVPTWTRQDLVLQNLSIRLNDGAEIPIEFLEFGQTSAESVSAQLVFDFWLLPFINVFAAVGKVDGDSTIPLSLQGRDLMDLIGVGDLCDGLFAPESCFRTFSATAEPEFNGENYSLGLTAAMGYRQFFFALPVTYTWSDLDITEQTIKTFYISPRIGVNAKTQRSGALSIYIGGAYLDATVGLTGSFTLDTSDIPGAPELSTLDYSITQSNKDKWNFMVGFNWDVSRSWSAQFEASAGGSREQMIASGTWRF